MNGKVISANTLCLSAHSDDIEIGCGGTILRLLGEYKNAHVTWAVFSGAGQRIKDARNAASLFLNPAKKKKVIIKNFKDGDFPYQGKLMKEYFETLKKMVDSTSFSRIIAMISIKTTGLYQNSPGVPFAIIISLNMK